MKKRAYTKPQLHRLGLLRQRTNGHMSGTGGGGSGGSCWWMWWCK